MKAGLSATVSKARGHTQRSCHQPVCCQLALKRVSPSKEELEVEGVGTIGRGAAARRRLFPPSSLSICTHVSLTFRSHTIVLLSILNGCSFSSLLEFLPLALLPHFTPTPNSQQMPIHLNPLPPEGLSHTLGDGFEVRRCEREDGGSGAGEADAQESGVGGGRVGGEDEGESGDLQARTKCKDEKWSAACLGGRKEGEKKEEERNVRGRFGTAGESGLSWPRR